MTEDVYQSRAKLATRLAFVAAGFGVACWAPLVPFAKTRCHLGDDTMGLVLLLLGAGSIAGRRTQHLSSQEERFHPKYGLSLLAPAPFPRRCFR